MTLELIDFVEQTNGVEFEDFSPEAQERIDGALADLTQEEGGPSNPPEQTLIWDWNDLDAVRDDLSGNYVLAQDLDENTAGYPDVVDPDGSGFTPIADSGDIFYGSFDGNGNTIKDLKVDTTSSAGLFGRINGQAVVRDFTIDDATIIQQDPEGLGSNQGTGTVTGYIQNSIIRNVNITNSTVELQGNIHTQSQGVGSVAGYGLNAGFEHIDVSGTTITVNGSDGKASNAGGVVGLLTDYSNPDILPTKTKIVDSDINADVNGVAALGGLVGKAFSNGESISIKRTSANGTVNLNAGADNAGKQFGGLVGLVGGSNPLEIEQTKFTGTVAGSFAVGGFVGKTGSGLSITNSFSNAQYELKLDTEGPGGGLIGIIDESVEIENTYAAGIDGATIASDSHDFGGIAGDVGRGTDTEISDITIENESVYFDTDTGVPDTFDKGGAEIPGVNTPGSNEMKGSSAEETMGEFDFEQTWKTRTGPDKFPDLRTFDESGQ